MTKTTEADHFRSLAAKLVAVPKAVIDKRQAAYDKAKAARKAKA